MNFEEPADYLHVLKDMLARLNICSYEFISNQYDCEVQAGSVIKPLQGPGRVNGNVSVFKPLLDSKRGVVLSKGLYPSYSDIDTYHMAACSIDTAIRNAISAGGSLDYLAILDNFCWCDSNNPARLGQLKGAGQACYDFATAYGTPFISGKDSMFNDFRGYDENLNEVEISIPPTLLISSIGVIEDVHICQTIDFKFGGDLIYILGETSPEMGGSEYFLYRSRGSGEELQDETLPKVDAEKNKRTYLAVEGAIKSGIVSSSISVEHGGAAIALAKSAIAGKLGATINLSHFPLSREMRDDEVLYSESQGRIILTVRPEKQKDFESFFQGVPMAMVGTVSPHSKFIIKGQSGQSIIDVDVSELDSNYRKTLKNY